MIGKPVGKKNKKNAEVNFFQVPMKRKFLFCIFIDKILKINRFHQIEKSSFKIPKFQNATGQNCMNPSPSTGGF